MKSAASGSERVTRGFLSGRGVVRLVLLLLWRRRLMAREADW